MITHKEDIQKVKQKNKSKTFNDYFQIDYFVYSLYYTNKNVCASYFFNLQTQIFSEIMLGK